MTKKTKLALFSIPILVGVYLIYRQFRKSKGQPAPTISDNPITNVVQSVVSPKCDFPLKRGVNNCDKVSELQMVLNSFPQDFPNKPLVVDGDFGGKTEQALMSVFGKKSIDSAAELTELYALQNESYSSTTEQWNAPQVQPQPNIFYPTF